MRLPQLQIESQPVRLDIQSRKAQVEIRQPRPEVSVQTTRPSLEIESFRPELQIDQTATWNAINGGKPEAFIQRIYSDTPAVMQQHAARTIQKWRQIADLQVKENPLPDVALSEAIREQAPRQVFGPASLFNTRINFEVRKPEISLTPGEVDIQVQTYRPEVDYAPASVQYAVTQYPKVFVTPPPAVELRA
ncbi:hypothetical protein HGI30_21120 [Paenibacillus albicereus]|uniref:Uncharacterized protein n=1 Tax=Paenibacillus albicereus TaxID=2726185 RepID=A0A6H2H2Y4_9BACL|nr:DUF6470 family protein [Paenibacillus albicereus]QJC53776.1 hypothetical protein HGI30_21120 [Paenibacillus albicereus]